MNKEVKKNTENFSRIWNPFRNISTPNIVLCFPVIVCCGAFLVQLYRSLVDMLEPKLKFVLHPFYTRNFPTFHGLDKREWSISSNLLNLFINDKSSFSFTFTLNPEGTKRQKTEQELSVTAAQWEPPCHLGYTKNYQTWQNLISPLKGHLIISFNYAR